MFENLSKEDIEFAQYCYENIYLHPKKYYQKEFRLLVLKTLLCACTPITIFALPSILKKTIYYYTISVTATGSNGENLNATSYVIEGQEKVDLLDKLAEANLINNTEEIDALIEVNSDNFEGIATTTFDVSSIANTGDEVIILHFDEIKQEWEFIGQETVDENGLVTGDFTSYSPVAFVKVDKANMDLIAKVYNYNNTLQENVFYSQSWNGANKLSNWCTPAYSGYIGYDFEEPININKVNFITCQTPGYYTSCNYSLQCSNDKVNWIKCGTASYVGYNGELITIENNQNENYRYYKISFSFNNSWTAATNIQFFENLK